MQTEHRSALAKKDRQVQHLQRELERAQQQCEASKSRAAPLSCTFETGTASGPQRKCFQEHNITAEKKPASVKPTVVTSTVVPPVNRYASLLSHIQPRRNGDEKQKLAAAWALTSFTPSSTACISLCG